MANQAPTSARIQLGYGVLWGGTALSLCFVAFRIVVRYRSWRRLFADDYLVLAAWLMFLISAAIWQSQQTAMYTQFQLSAGVIIPTPEVLAAQKTFLRSSVVTIMIYYTSLWTIKISFLVFFRRLGQKVRGHRIWWWCVLSFTVATWITCIGSMGFKCLLSSLEYIFTECTSPAARSFQWATLNYGCAVDVITDAAIITIPVLMLWNVRIPWRKKLALMSLFSLTVIIIIFSIVRVALVRAKDTTADISWLYMWSNIEITVALIVACLASFRQLFVMSAKSDQIRRHNSAASWRRRLLSTFGISKSRSSAGNQGFFARKQGHGEIISSPPGSKEHIVPLDTVQVMEPRVHD